MITKEKLAIYRRWSGDIDSWTRAAKKAEKSAFSTEDWYLIDSFVQDVKLVNTGKSSAEFADSLKQRIAERCDTDETAALLFEPAEIAQKQPKSWFKRLIS